MAHAEPTLTPRLTYDASVVDALVGAMASDLAELRAELAVALERADEAERQAASGAADTTLLGRAFLLLQRVAGESGLLEAPERPDVPCRVPEPVMAGPLQHWTNRRSSQSDDGAEYFRSLRAALDDGEPLGPRDYRLRDFDTSA